MITKITLLKLIHEIVKVVEEILRNGCKTTSLQLNASLKDIKSRIASIIEPLIEQTIQLNQITIDSENAIVIKFIIFYRQCERFIYDLLNTLRDSQTQIDRYIQCFRNQLNEIHEIVKFRTVVPIKNIFVSISKLCRIIIKTIQSWNI